MPSDTNKVLAFVPRPSELQALIHEIAKDSSKVFWEAETFETHAQSRMEWRDIDDGMMFEVLRTGYVKGAIFPGKYPGEWKVKMCKKMKGQRDVGVVTIVIHNRELFIKTVEWEDPK